MNSKLWIAVLIFMLLLVVLCMDENNTSFKPTVYASFTSIPYRLNNANNVITNINNQSYPIERIFLNIPVGLHKRSNEQYFIPNIDEKNNSNVTIVRCPEYGPATKLLGAIEFITDPEAYIWVLDDDIIYGKNSLQRLINQIKHNDIDVIYNSFCYAGLRTKEGICGYAGVLIKRKVLDDIYDYFDNLPSTCLTVDDQWMGMYLHSKTKKILKMSIPKSIIYRLRNLKDTSMSDYKSLSKTVNSKDKIFGKNNNNILCRNDIINNSTILART